MIMEVVNYLPAEIPPQLLLQGGSSMSEATAKAVNRSLEENLLHFLSSIAHHLLPNCSHPQVGVRIHPEGERLHRLKGVPEAVMGSIIKVELGLGIAKDIK